MMLIVQVGEKRGFVMRYPNAQKGVKKIFIAEVLMLIGSVFVFLAAFMGAGASGIAKVGGAQTEGLVAGLALGALVSLLGATLLPLIAYIMNLVGVVQARKDEGKNFSYALYCIVGAIVVTVVSGFFGPKSIGGSLLSAASNVLALLAFIYTIYGVRSLAATLGRTDIVDLGNKSITFVAVLIIISVICNFIMRTFAGSQNVVGAVAIVGMICGIIGYIFYLRFLSRASKMFDEC